MKADAVFEGGGVKGIGLVGALCYAEEVMKIQWQNLAGTSAGAIIAALLASGHTSREIREILFELDFAKIKDAGFFEKFCLFGKTLNLILEKGIYEGRYIENFIAEKLANKGVKVFGDLLIPGETNPRYKYRLNVIASDISRGKMLVLPQDIKDYGFNPDELSVARAIRMSISIPLFFEPVIINYLGPQGLKRCFIVDGGILSNYPVWLYDTEADPPWPTIGFKLVEPNEGQEREINSLIDFLSATVSTMMEAHDARHIQDANFQRTIAVPTMGVKTTDFNISDQKKEILFRAGYNAAKGFFNKYTEAKYLSLHSSFERKALS